MTIYGNVVYDAPGNYSLRVPLPGGRHKKKLGMTGMEGRHGILKSDFNAQALRVSAASVRPLAAPLQPLATPYNPLQPLTTPNHKVRVDDLVAGRDVCLFKADVEGYEPQVPQ